MFINARVNALHRRIRSAHDELLFEFATKRRIMNLLRDHLEKMKYATE